LFSEVLTAHKPKVKAENFGNVKTFFRSGFNFGDKIRESQEMKIHIIGKLSETIAKRLSFKDTLMIEYERSYNKNKLVILENDNSNYKVLGLNEGAIMKSNRKGMAVRIVDENINVIDILKLVEYSILNKKKINRSLIPTDHIYDSEGNKITVLANSEDFIQKITQKKSDLISEIIKSEILLLDNGSLRTEISWKNNEFIFAKNTKYLKEDNDYKNEYVSYKVSDFKYYIDSFDSSYFLIFNEVNTFTYFDGLEENTSLKINVENNWYAFNLAREKLGYKIILYDTSKYFYIYDIKKKLLQKIE
jgi:hypothetical protein